MIQNRLKSFAAALLLLPTIAFSQEGNLDPLFNPGDLGYGYGDGANGGIGATAIQPDGKILFGGNFYNWNSTWNTRIARVNPDGSSDTTFKSSTGANNAVNSIAVQPDGKIVIAGSFFQYNGVSRVRVARLNSDGTLDATFNPNSGANGIVNVVAVQPDGKILIGGNFWQYNGVNRSGIARLNADGTLDATFTVGTGTSYYYVYGIQIQPDGKILIAGNFYSYNGNSSPHIARLNADGTFDATFAVGTGTDADIYAMALQSDGKILVGGMFADYNGTAINNFARLNSDGTLDATFNPGSGINSNVLTLSLQTDGKIIAGGYFTTYNGNTSNYLARINSDGSFDSSFNTGTGASAGVLTSSIQIDGKIIIGGTFGSYDGHGRYFLTRVNANGGMDTTFNPGQAANGTVLTMNLQNDGKILIGGYFSKYFEDITGGFVRLNNDGSLDNTFNPGTGANMVMASAIQPDGKIIIGGDFTNYNGTAINRVARLNSDGSLDTTFKIGSGAIYQVYAVAVQADGKILVGGYFSNFAGSVYSNIVRLNSDGSVDVTFNGGVNGANDYVQAIEIQPDGKILIAGYITSYNGTTVNHIARLNSNGTLDGTFNMGTGLDQTAYTITLQADGKILIGGAFTTYNGDPSKYIVRVNSNGTIDPTFQIGTGFNSAVFSIAEQYNGKLVVGGWFTTYNGNTENYLIRLDADGSKDNTFVTGTGASLNVQAVAIDASGQILIGGDFTSYNGTGRNRIARLNGTVITGINEIAASSNKMNTYPNPFNDMLYLKAESTIQKIRLMDITGKLISEQNCGSTAVIINTSDLTRGIYFAEIITAKGKMVEKVVKK